MAALFAVGAVLAAAVAGWNYFGHNREVRDTTATATGTVLDVEGRRRAVDVAVVRFTAAGRQVTARVPVDRRPSRRARVEIAYVRAEPTKARIVGNWAPAYERLVMFSAAFLAGAVITAVVDVVRRKRTRPRR